MLVTRGNCTEDLSQLRAVKLKIKVLVSEIGEKTVTFKKRSSLVAGNRSNKEVTSGAKRPKTCFTE